MKNIIYKILKSTRLISVANAILTFKILEIDFGHFVSSWLMKPLDKYKREIPWFTYPAIEYLDSMDLSKKILFEYGSGNSTIYWSKRVKKIFSIDHDQNWFKLLKKQIVKKHLRNIDYELLTDKNSYVHAIKKKNILYGIIIVDGEHRFECAKEAVHFLKKGGFIILDNSDWFPKICEFLRNNNLIEIKFSGFAPSNHYTSTTSFFLTREFKFKSNKKASGRHIGCITPSTK